MYRLINENNEWIIEQIRIKAGNFHITGYYWLLNNLKAVDVSKDVEYQRRYKYYWAMNPARLSNKFLDKYFTYLEGHKNDQLIEYKKIYDFLTNEYQRILNNNYLQVSIQMFRERLHPQVFSDTKIIDSLIWQFVSLAKKGELLKCDINYL